MEHEFQYCLHIVRTRVSLCGAHVYLYEPPFIPSRIKNMIIVHPRYPNGAIIRNTWTRAHACINENRYMERTILLKYVSKNLATYKSK